MNLDDLDFDLPEELIAQHPLEQRDACRLLQLERSTGSLRDLRFDALLQLLRSGDVLVRNVSRVIPARLPARRARSGGACELLLVEPEEGQRWWALTRPARGLRPGMELNLEDGTAVHVVRAGEAGRRLLEFDTQEEVLVLARRLGRMPLPPYIRREVTGSDRDSYQTVYARVDGSVAAPTAGLHFTAELLQRLESAGIGLLDVVLHVGPGTFSPIRTTDPRQHLMDWERFDVASDLLSRCHAARHAGGRVVAVGTTTARVLESLARWEDDPGTDEVELRPEPGRWRGRTRLFLYPGRAFRCVDVLLTNFHLPRSSLLLLVDAFAGRTAMRRAYAHAVRQRYRFFSYGDAMWIE